VSTLTVTRWDGNPISEPGCYSHVPIEIYHSADICAGPSISSSGLRTIFNDCPLAYWIESPLNPNRVEPDEKEAFTLGKAAHHLVLGEAEFSRYFVARPERLNGTLWNGNRTDCKEWLEHCRDQGLTVLTPAQIEQIRGMAGLLPWQKNLEDSGLLNSAVVRAGALSGLVEHTIIARDKETGVFLKSRPDAIPLDSSDFSDFKTTTSVHPIALQRTLDDFRYDMQAILASLCLEQAAGLRFTSYGFVFAMKRPPFAVEVVELKDGDLEEAEKDLRAALRTFAHCLDAGRWPGPGGLRGDARFIERSTRSRENALVRRTMLELELEAA
jgi:hypothetical protein